MKIFKEEQRFTQTWLILLIVVSAIVLVAIILKDAESMSLLSMISTLSVVILVPALIFTFKLTSRIDDKGIHYRFFPFHLTRRTLQWYEIKNAYVRTYDPIGEYGGWGIKGGFLWNKKKGIAVNVSGDIGIQIELKSGKKILLGTKKETDSKNVLDTYRSKFKNN